MSEINPFTLVPNTIDKAAANITDPLSKDMGQTLADCWFLVFGGIHQVAEKRKLKYVLELEEFKDNLTDKIGKIPQEKLVEPKMQVVAPALENAKYCIEEKELRELFENLISASLNKDTTDQVHPSFADIIKRMSPRDASNLASFGNCANFPIAQYKNIIGDGYAIFIPYVFLQNSKYADLHKQSESISMLITLGLVEVQFGVRLSDYGPFYKTEEYKAFKEITNMSNHIKYDYSNSDIPEEFKHILKQRENEKHSIEVVEGMISLTPIGESFKQICMPYLN